MRLLPLLFLLTAALGTAHAATPATDACTARATAMLDAWQRGDNDAARADMSGFMKLMSPDDQLDQSREEMAHVYGRYLSRGDAVARPNGKSAVFVRIPLHYSGGTPTATFNCDLQDHTAIASFAVLRPGE